MNYQILLLMLMPVFVVFMAWYANASKRDKIYCILRRPNKTKREQFVKMTSQYVFFEGKRFRVVPKCITFKWWTVGFIHIFFPQWVATLDYTYSSEWPLDPDTLDPVILSPEVRVAMDKEETFRAYNKSFTPPAAAKRGGFMEKYGLLVVLGIVGLMAVFFFMSDASIKQQLAALANQIKALAR